MFSKYDPIGRKTSSAVEESKRTVVAGSLAIGIIESGDACTVQLRGDLDHAAAPQFESEFSQLLAAKPGSLTLDLAKLAFLDSAGISALLIVARQAETSGSSLRFLAPRGQPEYVLAVTGLSEYLRFTDWTSSATV
jgi:anti-sigma B factor antagonist